MKVLFLMFAFPDMNTSFNMYTTLVEEFASNGHELVVVAPSSTSTGIKIEKGIDVLRVKTLPIKNVPNYLKGISNVLLPYQFKRAIKKFYPKHTFDLIISPTPPITLVDVAAGLKKQHHATFYLILRDIFPQNAVDMGFMKKGSLIYRFFRAKERKLYKEADYVGCMSQGNIDYVVRHNPEVSLSKLHELKNFQQLYHGFGYDHSHLRKKFGLEGKFVVVFGGNMGKPQQLENVLELARSCQEYEDVLFLLLGEGLQMQNLSKTLLAQNINNIKILSTIPKQEYQDLLNVCDLGLISLHQNFTIPNIPSKALDYFNVGLPILASIDSATDFGQILTINNLGLWTIAGNHRGFKANFDTLYHDKPLRVSLGSNGRTYFENNLTSSHIFAIINNKTSRSNDI